MCAFTSAKFYRPRKPPIITGEDIVGFSAYMTDIGILKSSKINLQLRYGKAIDQDDKADSWTKPVGDGTLGVVEEIEWDIVKYCLSRVEAEKLLAKNKKPIYRGHITLGGLSKEVADFVNQPSRRADDRLGLDTLSIHLGPVTQLDIENQFSYEVGWMSLSLSGYGSIYPIPREEFVGRLVSCPPVHSSMEFCRTRWPVPPEQPAPEVVQLRRQMGDLWIGEDYESPWDWRWGIESR